MPINPQRRLLIGALAGSAGLGLLPRAASATNTSAAAEAATTRTATDTGPTATTAASASTQGTAPHRFGIALVGWGSYAGISATRLLDARLARPAAIITGHPDKARADAARFGIPEDAIYGYNDYARIAEDPRIDAVHICLPVGLHAEHARRAFAAGKHVLCEKPLGLDVDEAHAMSAAAQRAGRVLMPAYRAWFSAPLQELIKRVREGTHGELVAIDAHKGFALNLPADNWRFDPALAGAGCLYDIGTYSVQLQRWLAGGLPVEVGASIVPASDPRFANVEADIAWWARFDNGVLATGSASWRYRIQNRLRAGCTQAWLDLDPATPAIGERLRIGADAPNRIEEILLPPRDQIPAMYDAFAEACLGRREVPVPAQQGIDDLRIMQALLTAAREGRPVTLRA